MAETVTQPEPAPEPPKAAPSMPSPSGFSNHAIHLVRTSQQINLSLSQMADSKASILMGATFVVFTISVGQAKSGAMPWSLGVLALFAFVSAMCAVFTVLPSISGPKAAKLNDGKPNKLFFGYFTHMDEEEWTQSILDDLRADETIFRTMLHDIYQNGQVLQRKKYRYLSIAYRSFMVGLCLTSITFVVEYVVRYS
ncbi:Pycsar system effector family protein [Novosphingobium sp. ERN07]|uniref:Pycsar system effector family protein n=1 Tax=Novosphingobium sp. ERN07 TaxID=2726187 RepID=UPI001F10F43B|nr:Pycsar system effector family protein [Novosphingobium sp. ERN07]